MPANKTQVTEEKTPAGVRWFKPLMGLAVATSLICLAMLAARSPLAQRGYAAVKPAAERFHARATFRVADDFRDGVRDWWGEQAITASGPGEARVEGLALHGETMERVSYRLDFEAKPGSEGIGWVVRAADRENYYAFRLAPLKDRSGSKSRLVRYPVVAGEARTEEQVEVDVPLELAPEEFHRISVRVRDDRMTTLIDGQGVDHWQDGRFSQGGVGFFPLNKQSGPIRSVSVYGNDDSFGLFLYGFVETLRAAGAVAGLVRVS